VRERWRPIFDGTYEVSDHGLVRRAKPGGSRAVVGHVMTPISGGRSYNGMTYLAVHLTLGSRRWCPRIHHLVAQAFLRPKREGEEINHKDSNKENNYWKNLEWTTRLKNMRHFYRHGRRDTARGERCGAAKLTRQQIVEIRSRYVRNAKSHPDNQVSLAKEFGVTQPVISKIVLRKSWSHVA